MYNETKNLSIEKNFIQYSYKIKYTFYENKYIVVI